MFTTDRRLLLHQLLKELTEYAYFQPPATVSIKYPAIVYQLNDIRPEFADDIPYRLSTRYQLTAIIREPDSDIPKKLAAIPGCRFDRFYVSDNLNHYVFNLYF